MNGRNTAADSRASLFLSIVLTGRNDGYGVDFQTRFLRTLAFNHRELTERRVPFEVVFVEWAPEDGRPLLIDIVLDTIPALRGGRTFRGIVVDRRYQEALSLNPRLEYLEFLAKNVGIRRAAGEYVLASNCDVFFGRRVLDVLEHGALEPRVLYRAARHDLKMTVDTSRVDWALLEDPLTLEWPAHVLKPPLMGGGTGDFMLLDRPSFHTLGGFNEVYRVARIGIDQNFVVKALSAGISVCDIGGPVYHVNHPGSYKVTRETFKGREHEAHYGNIHWHSRHVVYANPPTWGLADAPEYAETAQKLRLPFSWDAVPPLVDLRRVVLPAARLGSPYAGSHARR
jgi:hypothetical protein